MRRIHLHVAALVGHVATAILLFVAHVHAGKSTGQQRRRKQHERHAQIDEFAERSQLIKYRFYAQKGRDERHMSGLPGNAALQSINVAELAMALQMAMAWLPLLTILTELAIQLDSVLPLGWAFRWDWAWLWDWAWERGWA